MKTAQISALKGWPAGVREVGYESPADGSLQPALAYSPSEKGRRPLLVALHTWSAGYRQLDGEPLYAKWCVENGWHFIHPDFRGPNDKPQALGSDLAVADIVGAVEFMKSTCEVDGDRIYLVGVSGGGHASLLMAARRPDIWAGVSSWCPISDVRKWHSQCKFRNPPLGYFEHIEKACGGDPDSSQQAAWECLDRSSVTTLASTAKGVVNLDINAGVHDGRDGSVPFSHSLYAFNEVAARREDVIDPSAIEEMYESMRLPHDASLNDPLYGERRPLYRRTSGNARVTVFEGGHEIVHVAALNWLAVQRRGVPSVWDIPSPVPLDCAPASEMAGK